MSLQTVSLFDFDFFQPLPINLHMAAMNLLVRLRRAIADPPPAPEGDVPVAALEGVAPFNGIQKVWGSNPSQLHSSKKGAGESWGFLRSSTRIII